MIVISQNTQNIVPANKNNDFERIAQSLQKDDAGYGLSNDNLTAIFNAGQPEVYDKKSIEESKTAVVQIGSLATSGYALGSAFAAFVVAKNAKDDSSVLDSLSIDMSTNGLRDNLNSGFEGNSDFGMSSKDEMSGVRDMLNSLMGGNSSLANDGVTADDETGGSGKSAEHKGPHPQEASEKSLKDRLEESETGNAKAPPDESYEQFKERLKDK
jgi:hypothetical protein